MLPELHEYSREGSAEGKGAAAIIQAFEKGMRRDGLEPELAHPGQERGIYSADRTRMGSEYASGTTLRNIGKEVLAVPVELQQQCFFFCTFVIPSCTAV